MTNKNIEEKQSFCRSSCIHYGQNLKFLSKNDLFFHSDYGVKWIMIQYANKINFLGGNIKSYLVIGQSIYAFESDFYWFIRQKAFIFFGQILVIQSIVK